MSRSDLSKSVAIVGGGAKNLGRLISLDLARKGAKVVVHFNSESTREDADKTVEDIIAEGGSAIAFQADLTVVEKSWTIMGI